MNLIALLLVLGGSVQDTPSFNSNVTFRDNFVMTRTSTGRLDWAVVVKSLLSDGPYDRRYEVSWGGQDGRGSFLTFRTLAEARAQFDRVKGTAYHAMLVDRWRDNLTIAHAGCPILGMCGVVPGLLQR